MRRKSTAGLPEEKLPVTTAATEKRYTSAVQSL